MKKLFFPIITIFFLLHSNTSISQVKTEIDTTLKEVQLTLIVMNNGEQLVGELLSDDAREILLLTKNRGKIYIPKIDIREMKDFKEQKIISDGEYVIEGSFTTRYAFTTNALPIKKYVNYAMINLYGPEIHFALTNNLSLGVMTTWWGSPIALAAKYTLKTKNKNLNFAIGSLTGTTLYHTFLNSSFGSLNWITSTYGNRINNVSFSAGYIVSKIDPNNSSTITNHFSKGPMFSIAGIYKIGKKTSVFFDSMFADTKKNRAVRNDLWLTSIDQFGNTIYTPYTEIKNELRENISFFIMPGIRIQQTDSRAFQFSCAGVVNFSRTNNGSFSKNSFPIPMCSWLFKL
jgi:hypothetical protein